MRAAVIYWSKSGNTEKVARAIDEALRAAGIAVDLLRLEEADGLDFYAYDLLCLGFPSYRWSPPKPVDAWLNARFSTYREQGRIKACAPPLPGKHAFIFCTYSGPHTGLREAAPAGLYAGQFFEHLGIPVLDELYVVGEFHGSEERSTQGYLGDIRGRPNADDLAEVRQRVTALVAGCRP